MKKLCLLALVALVALVSLPALADTPTTTDTPAALCSADAPAADALEVVLDVTPAQPEACYPAECPCPAGYRCLSKCCV